MIRDAWCRETSVDPDGWSPENPAWGQCAVTALVVQSLLGGDIYRCAVMYQSGSHYFNVSHEGVRVDLTIEQFPPFSYTNAEKLRDRVELLENADTRRRYELLVSRVQDRATVRDAVAVCDEAPVVPQETE